MAPPKYNAFNNLRITSGALVDGCAGCYCGLEEDIHSPTFGAIYPTLLDFRVHHATRLDHGYEAVLWASQHCRAGFSYALVEIGSHYKQPRIPLRVWRWSFADPDDAVAFKMRWW